VMKGWSGVASTSASGDAGALGVDGWIEAGSPAIADAPPVPHQNEFYTTMDSLKCAKATAIVNEIWNVLTIGDAVADANNVTQVLAGIAGALGAFNWVIGYAVGSGYALASAVWTLLTGAGFAEYAEGMNDVYMNTDAKAELICDLVDRMTTPVKIGAWTMMVMTADDIKIALERFEEIVPHDDFVRETLGLFSIDGWLSVVTERSAGLSAVVIRTYHRVMFRRYQRVRSGLSLTVSMMPSIPLARLSIQALAKRFRELIRQRVPKAH